MKTKVYLTALAASLGLFVGCSPNNPPATSSESGQTQANATRDEYIADMNKKMDDLDAKIDALKAKESSNLSTDAKARTDQALADLRSQRDSVRKEYDELKASSADTWDKTKADFQAGWDKLVKTYDDTVTKVTGTPPSSS